MQDSGALFISYSTYILNVTVFIALNYAKCGPKLNSTRSTLLEVDKADRVALAPYTLATKSTATNCRIHVVADLLPKVATKLKVSATKLNVYGNSQLCCRFVAGFGNSLLSTKSTV